MKFAVPYAYYCSDEQHLSPKVIVIEATHEREALRNAKEEIIEICLISEEDNDPDITREDALEIIPSVWIEGQEGDEEGYVIGVDIIEI